MRWRSIAPTRFAAAWDNVGLLVGDPAAPCRACFLTIDCTRAVLVEARAGGRVGRSSPTTRRSSRRRSASSPGRSAFEAARAGLAVYSPHTALDVAAGRHQRRPGGLARDGERTPLRAVDAATRPYEARDVRPRGARRGGEPGGVRGGRRAHRQVHVVQLPVAGDGNVPRRGRGAPGRRAGRASRGGRRGAARDGRAGRGHRRDREGAAGARIRTRSRRSILCGWRPAPSGLGLGRVGAVDAAPAGVHVERVKHALGLEHVLVAGSLDREVTRAAVCAGSGGDLIGDAFSAGAHLLLTGRSGTTTRCAPSPEGSSSCAQGTPRASGARWSTSPGASASACRACRWRRARATPTRWPSPDTSPSQRHPLDPRARPLQPSSSPYRDWTMTNLGTAVDVLQLLGEPTRVRLWRCSPPVSSPSPRSSPSRAWPSPASRPTWAACARRAWCATARPARRPTTP